MDPKERLDSLQVAIDQAMRSVQARIWTSLPGIIESFDPVKMTATVQPTIQGLTSNADGSPKFVNMPLLLDCPVVFPRGGGFTLTFPITQGDDCKITFSCRCIDGWWLNGGVQPPLEYRMHDLSDAFVEVGPMSQEHLITGVSTTAAQLRSDDGTQIVEVGPSGITLTSGSSEAALTDAGLTITAGSTTFAFTSAGFAQTGGTVHHDGHDIGKTHKHTLVTVGTDVSGPPQ